MSPDAQASIEQAQEEPRAAEAFGPSPRRPLERTWYTISEILVIQLSSTGSRHSVQIFITLQTSPLNGFSWPHGLRTRSVAPFPCPTRDVPRAAIPLSTRSGWRQPTNVSIASLTLVSIIRSGPSRCIVETTTPPHRPRRMHIVVI